MSLPRLRLSRHAFWRLVLVLAVLVTHLVTRFGAASAVPLADRNRGMYLDAYRFPLSLLAGRGFHAFSLDTSPAAAPIREFLNMRRPALAPSDLAAAFAGGAARPLPDDALQATVDDDDADIDIAPRIFGLQNDRIFELRLAAFLWRIFGLRWSVLFTFYIFVSTASCLLVFLLARKMGGFWVGLLAAAFFTASPIEGEFVMRSLRDIYPLWFAIASFWATFCLAGRYRSALVNRLSYAFAGAVSMAGLGWRPDALLIFPLLLLVLAVGQLIQRPPRRAVLSLAAFSAGAAGVLLVLRLLTPAPQTVIHAGFAIGYYGQSVRYELLGLEDSHGIFRCDVKTAGDVRDLETQETLEHAPIFSTTYNAECRQLWLGAIADDSYHLIAGFPDLCRRAWRPAFADLPINHDQGGSSYRPATAWPAWLAALRGYFFNPLNAALPALALAGLAAALFQSRQRLLVAAVSGFLLYYLLILYLILPEYKHAGMLVFPLSILAALGVAGVVRLIRLIRLAFTAARSDLSVRGLALQLRRPLIIVLSLAAIWGIALALAYPYCKAQRQRLIQDIHEATVAAEPAPQTLLSPHIFSVSQMAGDVPDPVGYLLEIQSGPAPAGLICRRIRTQTMARCYESHHPIAPNQKQFFFVVLRRDDAAASAPRPYICTALLTGDAVITSVRRVALPRWPHLETSTVFFDGQESAGSPVLAGPSNQTWYALPAFDGQGLTAKERAAMMITARSDATDAGR